jgi:acetyl-CoA carboxylase carboxyltransferase component
MPPSREWQPELEEMQQRRAAAEAMGGAEAVQRLHAAGRLSARERIAALADPGSFREFGMLAGQGRYDGQGRLQRATPSTQVMGLAHVEGRRVVLIADDASIRGASSEAAVAEKWIYAERYAFEYRLPLVRLVDSAGGSVKLLLRDGATKIPGYPLLPMTAAVAQAPVIGVALGACAGLAAARVATAHCSIMIRGRSQVFAAGPPVVKQALGQDVDKEALGGWTVHRHSGVVQQAVDSEAEAFALARRFLSYLPGHVWELPPVRDCDDPATRTEAWLNDAIPRDRRRVFKPHRILEAVFDRGSLLELAPEFGASTITALARLGGRPVGVISNNPAVMGGALTRAAALKLERFVDLCDSFHLPIANLQDQPGVMSGLDAEREGTLLAALRANAAIEQSSVPWCAVVLRRCFGLAGAMLSPYNGASGTAILHRFAWPSARWGSIPIEGGVAAAHRQEIEAAEDPQLRRAELEAQYHALGSPLRTAERFGVVDVIEPAQTRPLLCDWAEDAYRRLAAGELGPKRRTMR